jgi:tetratricopeptide (TPR) repeat protein
MQSARWRWWGGACLVAALMASAAPANAQQSQNWTWCVNKGKAFPSAQAVKGCTAVIQSGRETQRNMAIAFNNRGIAYYGDDDYDHAIPDFTEAIRLDPGYADAWQSRASAYSDKGDHDHAIADYNESIRLNQKNPVAFNNRCDELLIIHQVQAAIADCNESLRQRPNHANTLMHRGNALLAAGQFDKAIADYNVALSQNPKDAWSLYGRGYAKVKKGDSAGNAEMADANAMERGIAEAFADRGVK